MLLINPHGGWCTHKVVVGPYLIQQNFLLLNWITKHRFVLVLQMSICYLDLFIIVIIHYFIIMASIQFILYQNNVEMYLSLSKFQE